jgi:hypothetical protein
MSPTATLTWTYREFDIFNPKSWVFSIDDISQALSNQCRFNGHVDFYSVAEHCVRVSQLLEADGHLRNTQLLGLLHDAAEAYIGDIPGPWKPFLSLDGRPLADLEKEIELALFGQLRASYSDIEWSWVKDADKAAYKDEAACRPAPGHGWDPPKARTEFLARYHALKR